MLGGSNLSLSRHMFSPLFTSVKHIHVVYLAANLRRRGGSKDYIYRVVCFSSFC